MLVQGSATHFLTVEVELFLERYYSVGTTLCRKRKNRTAAQFALSFERHGLRH
jgi:hypothetical protein